MIMKGRAGREQSWQEDLSWAEQEFITANLGDKRLNKRMVKIAEAFSKKPEAAIPEAMGDWAGIRGAYRFFDHWKVQGEKIMAPHREASGKRVLEQDVVLVVQDTSFIDYSSHPATEGLGLLNDENHQGLILHPSLAVSTDRVPLGVIDMQILTRDEIGSRGKRRKRPLTEKESRKWLESYRATVKFAEENVGPSFVNVADREGDIYDLFAEVSKQKQRSSKPPDVLVRAAWNRRIEEEASYIWEHMSFQGVVGTIRVQVPRKPKRPAREAKLSIRYSPITIKAPKYREGEGLESLEIWAIYAKEQNPPKDADPISWMLLTTLPVDSFDEAVEKVQWYLCRWVIELYFKVLKSGCQIEERQLEAAHRLRSCLAMDSIIAWRILFLTMIGRELPHLPASTLFEGYEWKALYAFVHQTTETPKEVPTLGEVIREIGKLGGFIGRKRDGEPGIICFWRGMWRLSDISATWKLFNQARTPSGKGKTYG